MDYKTLFSQTKPIKHEELVDILYRVSKKINSIKLEPEKNLLADLGENYIWDKKKLVLKKGNNIVDLARHELLLLQL